MNGDDPGPAASLASALTPSAELAQLAAVQTSM
jgi:hypothetical protein